MKKIIIINGPNLNMLGVREPEIYGHHTLADIEALCNKKAASLELDVDCRQSNHEGDLVTWIQEAREYADGVIINAAAYTHTSVAIHDALKLLSCPIIEVHLSNPKDREVFRHFSYIETVATTVIAGHGIIGYDMALEEIVRVLQ